MNREFVTSNNNIKLFDSDGKLELFCYTKCDDNDAALFKRARGVVFDGDKLIAATIPYVVTFSILEKVRTRVIYDNFENYDFYASIDGTILRLFFANEKWNLSTFKRLNAFDSRWASDVSFGTIFANSLGEPYETFLSKLDESKQYIFLLPRFLDVTLFVGEYNSPEDMFFTQETVFENLKTLPRLCFQSSKDVYDFINDIQPPESGVLCINKETGEFYKIVHHFFFEFSKIRGNIPDVLTRYLQIRTNKELSEDFYNTFDDYKRTLDRVEINIEQLSHHLYGLYKEKYLDKTITSVPPAEHFILRRCNQKYPRKPVTPETIYRILNIVGTEQPSRLLNLLVNIKF
jgi:hypothetical protein